jgi:demethoxyubiquinone hydroxylase (CLK1/Coq7/Cat5 family)
MAARSVIIKGNKDFTKEHLERLVVQHGGDYCQAQLADGSAMVISSSEKSRLALGSRTPSGIDHLSALNESAESKVAGQSW